MKFVSTAELDPKVVEAFFEDKWDELEDRDQLVKNGYFIEYNGDYKGYFALTPVTDNAYWLKSLYLKQGVPAALPLTIIETATAITKQKQADDMYVFSHQQSLDTLLTMLQFETQEQPSFADQAPTKEGTWWKITIPSEQAANE
ncbi:hypothetical protein [Aquibacillus sediminis]|uniref:hypothetical protein n=1 Tax=Aquibacillus sediminis TaxID=2574734 RepID=UPI0011083621|nr:hypothetical protein [Aquibacillus sediminis]